MPTPDFISAASSIVTGPLSFLLVIILTLEWRFSDRVMRVLIPAFIGLLSAGSAVYFVLFGVNTRTKLQTALFAIVSFILFNLIVTRYPLLQILSTYTTACIFTFISDTLCGVLAPEPGLAHILVKAAVFLAVAGLLLYFFRRPLLEVQREIQRKNWLWMMVVPLLMCFVFFYAVQMRGPLYEDPAFRPVVLALCFCALSVYISFYFVLCSLQKQYRMQSETAVLQVHLSSLKKHAETMRAMSDHLSLFHHDLRHYMRIQSVCLENGDLEGMKKALESLRQCFDGLPGRRRMRQYTGQPLIDAVLSYYTDRAEQERVAFEIRLELPGELEDVAELAVVLSNALENASDACRAMEPDAVREIRVRGGTEQRQFLLEIANTYSGAVRFDRRGCPVAQRQGHGYGTQSITSYAAKHRAQLYYKAEGGWFRLRLLMALQSQEAPALTH